MILKALLNKLIKKFVSYYTLKYYTLKIKVMTITTKFTTRKGLESSHINIIRVVTYYY